LIFVKHENFPDGYANIVRHFEFQQMGETLLKFPQELYGPDVRPEEWLSCVGKQAKEHRPLVLTLDDGIKENAVSLKAMRDSACSFVIFLRAWSKEGFQSFSWRLLKCWPKVVEAATAAHTAGRQCRIEVSINGKTFVTNL